MEYKILSIIIASIFAISQSVEAQSAQGDFKLSPEEIRVVRGRAAEKVALMNSKIVFMADPVNEEETRFGYKEEAQGLFINDCKSFKEVVKFKDGSEEVIKRDGGVTMQVSSTRRKMPSTKLMTEYFYGLIRMNYKYVHMKTTEVDAMRVSRLRAYGKDQNGNQLFICSIYFDQVFVGITPEGRKYQDLTHKWAVCYVQVDEVIDPTTGDYYREYTVRLGDVNVISTEKLWND